MRVCKIEGCGKKHKGQGYCAMHLRRFKLYGDPHYTIPKVNQQELECTIEGCTNKIHCRGLCDNHYRVMMRNGDPLAKTNNQLPSRSMTREEKLAWYGKFDVKTGCVNFTGRLSRADQGYAKLTYKGIQYRAHRFAYETRYGEIPLGMCVLHKCDNRKCINPDHLFLGTRQDNMDDMVAKGRAKSGWHGNRINQETADFIRKLKREQKWSTPQIADHLSLKYQHVQAVLAGRIWKEK